MAVTQATPNRKTRVRFNRFMPSVLCPPVFFSRDANEIGRGEGAKITNCVLIKGVGWTLRGRGNPEEHWESPDAQTPRPGTVATGIFSYFANLKQTLSGVTYSGRADQSNQLFIKRVADGASWVKSLTSDLTSYPGPDITSFLGLGIYAPTTTMDRQYISSSAHDPDDAVSFEVGVHGTAYSANSIYAQCYFCGPAGKDGVLEGLGQYCVALAGGGVAFLLERGNEPGETDLVWRVRSRFNVAVPGTGGLIRFTVHSDCTNSCGGSWKGTTLSIVTQITQDVNEARKGGLFSLLINSAITAVESSIKNTFTYTAPGAKDRPITLAPVRIDGRSDVRLIFNAFDTTYPESGVIEDTPFPIGVLATSAKPIIIDAYDDRPPGTDIEYKLYAVDGVNAGDELAATTLIDDCLGKRISYAIASGYPLTTQFKFVATLTSDGTKRPTFKGYVPQRDAVMDAGDSSNTFDFPARTAGSGSHLPLRVVESVSMQGLSADAQSESATVALADLTAGATQARERTGTPVDIDITTDAGTLITRLFRGTIQTVGTRDLAAIRGGYPAEGAWRGEVAMASEMRRLNRRLAPSRIFLWDTLEGKPMKVTDALKTLLGPKGAGYATSYIGIPDLPIRLMGANQEDLVVEPDTPLGDVCAQLVGDYLGGVFFWCANSGADGMWRILVWPRPPYNTVLRFDPYHPGGGRLRHILGAYDSITNESNGQVIQTLPTFRMRNKGFEPPEGNMVVVIGGNNKESIYASGSQMVQIAVNTDSFDPLGLGSGHAKYPDVNSQDFMRECVPIIIRDPTLSTPMAMNFVTRRVYDAACSAKDDLKFNSLLPFITDVEDPYQTLARIPRVGDMCEVRQPDDSWKPYVIAECNPNYRRSHLMRADFELVTTSRIDEIAIAVGSMNASRFMGKVGEHFRQSLGLGNARYKFSGNAPSTQVRSGVGALPAASLPPIQELDPASADYGKFYFMAGYDPVP